jgi:membrane-associated phospholipid phosphatase
MTPASVLGLSARRSLDERLLRVMRTWGHGPKRNRVVERFSKLGERGAVWIAIGAAGYAFDDSRRVQWRRAMGTVLGTYALNTVVKLVVRRRRPSLPGLAPLTSTPTQLSFPSAHASTSFAGALAYTRLGLPVVPLYALAKGLGVSRLYLGVHYPSDVLAGALLGTVVAALATDGSADRGGGVR